MIIRTKLTKEQYKSASIAILLSKKVFKVFAFIYSFVIIINIVSSTENTVNIIQVITPSIIILGIMYFIFNWSINKAYKNNPRLHETIEYQIEKEKLKIKGESFNSEMNWTKILKITKTKKWILLWHTDQIANALPIECLTHDNLKELKEIAIDNKLKNNL